MYVGDTGEQEQNYATGSVRRFLCRAFVRRLVWATSLSRRIPRLGLCFLSTHPSSAFGLRTVPFPIFDPSDTSMGDHSFVQLPVYTYMRNVPVAYDRASSPAKRGS